MAKNPAFKTGYGDDELHGQDERMNGFDARDQAGHAPFSCNKRQLFPKEVAKYIPL